MLAIMERRLLYRETVSGDSAPQGYIHMVVHVIIVLRCLYCLLLSSQQLISTLFLQKSDNALTSTAASECLSQFSTLLGPSILRGRIEMYNPR